jgi:phage shock protein PspC (stress-responsive transcriptional regulator)
MAEEAGHSGGMSEQTGTFVPPQGPPPGSPGTNRPPLRRSVTDRKVAGVCGGIAAHLGIDPLILRIVIVVLSIFGGTGLLLYAAGWLLIPDQGEEQSEVQHLVHGRTGPGSVLASIVVAIIGIGLLIGLASTLSRHWWFGPGPDVWPLLVIAGVGAAVWYSTTRQRSVGSSTGPPPAPPNSPGGYPAAPQQTTQYETAQYPAAGYTTAEYTTAAYGTGQEPWTATATVPPVASPAKAARRRERSVLGILTWSVALVAAGIMVLLDQVGAWNVRAVPFLAVLLGIVGLGLVAGAFIGRSRGLIVAGVLLSLITMIAAAAPGVDSRRAGAVTWTPTTVSSIPAGGYHWAAGNVQLDLSQLALAGQTVDIHVQVGAGRLRIYIPTNAQVSVNANVGVGAVRLLNGQPTGGLGQSYQVKYPTSASPSQGTIDLVVDLGAGNLEVDHAQA